MEKDNSADELDLTQSTSSLDENLRPALLYHDINDPFEMKLQ